jgi:hypothetical protein
MDFANSCEDMACCSSVQWNSSTSETVRNGTHVTGIHWIYKVSHTERSIFWEVIVSVITNKTICTCPSAVRTTWRHTPYRQLYGRKNPVKMSLNLPLAYDSVSFPQYTENALYRVRHKSVNRCTNYSAHRFRDYYISYLKYDHRQNVQRLTDLCRTLYNVKSCGAWWLVNWIGFGRKRSGPNRDAIMEEMLKTTKNFEEGSTCLDRDSSEHLQDISLEIS